MLDRVWKLAEHILKQPRITRRLTTQINIRPWKKRISDDLDRGIRHSDIRAFGREEIHSQQKPYRFVDRLNKRRKGKQYQVAASGSTGFRG